MQVSKWGNGLAVRLPKKLVEELGLAEGDEVNIISADARTLVVSRNREDDGDFLLDLRALQRPKPKGFVWSRDDAKAR